MKINELSKVFGTKTKAQEILFLLSEAKEVVRQGFYPEEFGAVEEFCHQNQLFIFKSQFKVVLTDNTVYSNQGVRVELTEPNGMFLVYISKKEDKALLASYHELVNDHQQLGLILGYPECCAQFFCQNFTSENTNPELPSGVPWTNLSKRAEDCVLLSHFPCHPNCQKSVELAKQYLNILTEQDSERAKEMISSLF